MTTDQSTQHKAQSTDPEYSARIETENRAQNTVPRDHSTEHRGESTEPEPREQSAEHRA